MIISGEQIGSQEKIFGRYALVEHVYPAEDPSGFELRGLCVSLVVNGSAGGIDLTTYDGVELGQAVAVSRIPICVGYNVIGVQETPMKNIVDLPKSPNYLSATGLKKKPVWILVQHWGTHNYLCASTSQPLASDDAFLFHSGNTGLVSGATLLEFTGPRTISGIATIQLDAAGTGLLFLNGTNDGTDVVWAQKPQVENSTWQAGQTSVFDLPGAESRMVALKYVGAPTTDPTSGNFQRTKGFVMCMGLNVR